MVVAITNTENGDRDDTEARVDIPSQSAAITDDASCVSPGPRSPSPVPPVVSPPDVRGLPDASR